MTDPQAYRCKHNVEAMQWIATPARRAAFTAWFERRGTLFVYRGPVAVVPMGDEHHDVVEGEWVVYSGVEFLVMSAEDFAETYEPVAPQEVP